MAYYGAKTRDLVGVLIMGSGEGEFGLESLVFSSLSQPYGCGYVTSAITGLLLGFGFTDSASLLPRYPVGSLNGMIYCFFSENVLVS